MTTSNLHPNSPPIVGNGSFASIDRITVVGAGTMGRGIAQVCATVGVVVDLVDPDAHARSRAPNAIATALDRRVKRGDLTPELREEILRRVFMTASIDETPQNPLLIEAIVEDLASKRALFVHAESHLASSAILASNTSSISITAMASALTDPGRVVGMHFFNPVPAMALVEVVRGHHTRDGSVATVSELAKRMGKTAVVVGDSPGFAANRILMPLLNEAMFALMEGVATPEAIDTVMRLGMGHPMGPLQLADVIGLDVCLAVMEVLHREIGDPRFRPCPLLRRYVAAGRLGRKTAGGFYDYP